MPNTPSRCLQRLNNLAFLIRSLQTQFKRSKHRKLTEQLRTRLEERWLEYDAVAIHLQELLHENEATNN